MAHFGKDLDDFKGSRCIHIRSSEQTENYTLYIITVTVGSYSWTVKHRYSEFHQLNEKLAASYKLDRSLLPPKKIFGNQTEAFIKKRQRELEIYLQTIVLYLAHHIPSCMAYFLDFDKYEIHGITQAMAEDLYSRGESLLASREKYEVTTLQLYSLTERLKLPEPTCDSGDIKKDLGHILDFITRAKHLKVVCGKKPVGSSNIMMSKLPFDLTLFKSLQTLEINGCNFRIVNGLEVVKQTVMKFEVHESTSSMMEILLQDAPHWRAQDGSLIVGYWDLVCELDFSKNSFSEIHESIQLMPNIEKLNLSHNKIESIVNLHWLSQLTHLDLSHNNIHLVDSLHTKLGNIKFLRLAHNKLESLHGFAKLFSLETLDVSYNKITSIDEAKFVSQLPCLEDLCLEYNPVTSSLDYRIKTLEMFGDRLAEVVLDNKLPDQKELDTLAVLQALKKAKDIRISKKPHPKKNTSAVSLSDMYSQSFSSSVSDHPDERNSLAASPPNDTRISMLSSLADWQRKDRTINDRSPCSFSQDSISSYNSAGERERETDVYSPTTSPLSGRAAHSFPAAGVSPAYTDSNNSNTDSRDMINAVLQNVIPEAHPFDLGIETSSVSSRSPHKQGNSVKGINSGKVTLTFSAADLPTTSNPAFLLWLNKHLFTSGDTLAATDSIDSGKMKESIIDILWCYMEQLSKPSILTPCCAVLTNRKFFIEKLTGKESSFPGVPELKPCSIVSIQNIQQLVLGPCHAFLRIEESFIGKSGVFTLFGIEPQALKWFFNKLFNACCEFDIINSYSFVDLTVKSDLLTTIALREEQNSQMPSDRLVSAALVQLNNSLVFNFLVLSENRVYCLDINCVHWPPATFETSPDDSIRFNIQHEFSILDKMSNIKISPGEDLASDSGKGKPEHHLSDPNSGVQFLPYELSMEVAFSLDKSGLSSSGGKSSEGVSESSLRHSTSIRYNFPSAACRDLFLDRLSNMRSELAHMMSPNVREEPEGGNEQLSPTDRHGFKSSPLTSLKSISSSLSGGLSFTQSSFKGSSLIGRQTPPIGGLSFTAAQTSPKGGSSFAASQTSPKGGILFAAGQTSPIGGLSFTADQAMPVLAAVYKEAVAESSKDAHPPAEETQDACNSYTEYRINKKHISSEPVVSDQSLGATFVTKGDIYLDWAEEQHLTLAGSNSCSPGDDLSISPTSNFSRASISPTIGHEHEVKNRINYSQATAIIQTNTHTKADSLPSSFDWKDYYFKSLPCPVHDTKTLPGLITSRSRSKATSKYADSSNTTSTHFDIQHHSPERHLEDIDSSSEFEPGSSVETELELYLKKCLKSCNLIHPLSAKLKPLCLMNGRELVKFFRSTISRKLYPDNSDMLSEELHYVLWSMVVPYTNPKNEIATLVMLSTHGIYLVSDTSPKMAHKSRPSWMTHSRNRSDSAITSKSEASTGGHKTVEPYFVCRYKDLLQVNIGLFDQCVRLTGSNENSVFTIATRDSIVTDTLVQKLKHVLSFVAISPVIEKSRTESEIDFYKPSVQNVKSTLDGIVYTHPSQVKFIYPGEDAVQDILYLVNERVASVANVSVGNNSKLWLYFQSYLLPSDDGRTSDRSQPRSVVITATQFCLAEEDIVTYPLPDFVRGVPENPCHEIVECRRIDSLKRITLFHGSPHIVSLTFMDEPKDIVVDVAMQHFGQIKVDKERQHLCPEVTIRLYVQGMKEKDKMVQMLDTLWKGLVTQVGRILDINKI